MILLLHTRKFQIKKWLFWGGFVDCYVLLTINLSVKNFWGGKTLIMVIMVVMSMAISHGLIKLLMMMVVVMSMVISHADNDSADDDDADNDGGGDVNGNLTCG